MAELFRDGFSGTNGDDLGGRTPDTTGTTWTLAGGVAGGAEINASNQLRSVTTTTQGSGFLTDDLGSTDHYVECRFLRLDTTLSYVAVRMTNNGTFAAAMRFLAGPNMSVWSSAGFTRTQIIDLGAVSSPSASDVWRLEVNGTAGQVYRNGVAFGSSFSVASSARQTAGVVARSAAYDPWIDDLAAGDLTGGSTSDGVGASNGAATVTGVGAAQATASGSSDGNASAAGVGASRGAAAGSAPGSSSANADGRSFAAATGTANGAAVVSAVGQAVSGGVEAGDGNAAGTSAASAVGAATTAANGSAGGIATAGAVGAAVGTVAAVGAATGIATAAAVGVAIGAQPTDDGGAGDGALGEIWARLQPLRPKRKKKRDARGIPPEWQEPAPPVPPEFKAPPPPPVPTDWLRGAGALRDMAGPPVPIKWRKPSPDVPPEWVEDDEEIELLLLV